MSGSQNSPGLLTGAVTAINDEFRQHEHAPPAVKASNRGYLGAALLSGSAYLFAVDDFVSYPEELKIGLAVAAVLGLLLLRTALRTRSQPEPLTAFFAVVVPLVAFYAVWNWMPELLDGIYPKGLCVVIACANLMRLYLAVRGVGGSARKLVVNDINQGGWKW